LSRSNVVILSGVFCREGSVQFARHRQIAWVLRCAQNDKCEEIAMNSIGRFLVRAKHWQVFTMVSGLVVISEIIALWWKLPGEGGWTATFLPLFLSTELCVVGYAVWCWSLGTFLNSTVSPELRLRMILFRAAVVFPPLYLPLFDAVYYSQKPVLLFVILPLHFFACFCIAYNLYFVSKSLVVAEKAVGVEFPNYIGTVFLLLLFPIGVWFTQPRINRIYAATHGHQTA
jgi:hypothetical protein